MIGAILGDIVGSRFEFHNHLNKDFQLLNEGNTFTDDTVMTCAVARAILDCDGDYSDLSSRAVSAMQTIGREYPNCGYGRKFVEWMFTDDPQPYNSCGNGSAMRISAVGFAAESVEQAQEMSAAVTKISHNHPEGMKGAEATAVAIVLARQGKIKDEIRQYVEENYGYDLSITVDEYREMWSGHGREICQISVPQAFACFLEGRDYIDVIRNCISIGGDSDTIAAIAGGIAEAYFGFPICFRDKVRGILDERLWEIVQAFEEKYPGKKKDYDVFDPQQTMEDYKNDVMTCLVDYSCDYGYSEQTARERLETHPEWLQEEFDEGHDPCTAATFIGYCCG
ncbi:MAG: ADP-ribosylglycohydrolase family protein [Eubacteriales bacterium]|nr:ADP-ribosylglycohydrolase family protein [Eubacteriales bacterium]